MFSSPAYAQAAGAAPTPSIMDSLPMIIIMFAIIYFLMIRPQNKRMKAHRAMVEGVQKGDTVVTSGGLVGKVTKVKEDNEIVVEIAEGVKVTVIKSTLSDVRIKGEPVKAD